MLLRGTCGTWKPRSRSIRPLTLFENVAIGFNGLAFLSTWKALFFHRFSANGICFTVSHIPIGTRVEVKAIREKERERKDSNNLTLKATLAGGEARANVATFAAPRRAAVAPAAGAAEQDSAKFIFAVLVRGGKKRGEWEEEDK